ncbi:MAG: ParA family protein [Cloacibacillus porcorum]|uniref:ParA family protein n=1 Tax=Cloacibacillus porcorum TaxID=1197717 RepID=UPI0023F4BAAE|nr:ParA family protein [Cloacibacillus porcorum]MCD7876213.1 ParA family protein [Cloacibacillus porcorum]
MKTIAFSMGKGGVGKTTLAVNFAWYLAAKKGGKTLLIDWDPQASATSFFVSGNVPYERSVAKLFDAGNPLRVLRNDSSIMFQADGNERLYVAPSQVALTAGERGTFELEATRRLKYWIDGTCGNFDYVIIDCPPSLGRLTLNALMASDYVVIPTTPEPMSFDAIPIFIQLISEIQNLNTQLAVLGIILNRMSENESAHRYYAQIIREQELYAGTLHKSAALVTMSHDKGFICDDVNRKANRKLLGEFEVAAEGLLKRIRDFDTVKAAS